MKGEAKSSAQQILCPFGGSSSDSMSCGKCSVDILSKHQRHYYSIEVMNSHLYSLMDCASIQASSSD